MRSEDLIQLLVNDAKPVRSLGHPVWRVTWWLSLSLVYLAIVVMVRGPRPDLMAKLGDPRFAIEISAALLTGIMAAAGAVCAGSPGRPLWERFAPVPFLVLWLGSLGEGCRQDWLRAGADGLAITPDFACFPHIVLAGFVPGALMLTMVRRGAPLAPTLTTALAALAAAALGAAALRLYHAHDASIMILVWQLGSVAMLTGLGALFGRKLLHWPHREAVVSSCR